MKEPSEALAQFLADMVCDDPQGYIAFNMARRFETLAKRYSKPLAKALLDERCWGMRRLPAVRRDIESWATK